MRIVWVNDYHLMLVPNMIRERLPDASIGFFLHIPFPSSEIFRCLHGKIPPPLARFSREKMENVQLLRKDRSRREVLEVS